MQVFRVVLAVAWLAVIWVSAKAILVLGAGSAGDVFFGDFAHPWRAQFNTDFSFHLALMAAWILFREKRLMRGIPFGLASVMFGGAFSLAYIFVSTFTAQGDMKRLVLGARA